MKAISLKQPWATLIVRGIKPIENRTWKSNHRGPLLIHASRNWDAEGALKIVHIDPTLTKLIYGENHHRGKIIGKVNMMDCLTYAETKDPLSVSKWFFGPYGYVFKDAKEFSFPVFYRGQLGIFDIPNPVIFQIFDSIIDEVIEKSS